MQAWVRLSDGDRRLDEVECNDVVRGGCREGYRRRARRSHLSRRVAVELCVASGTDVPFIAMSEPRAIIVKNVNPALRRCQVGPAYQIRGVAAYRRSR
jgi:hypothetical protein